MTITAAADGSALGNPGPAGWAWYVDNSNWAAGGWKHATNNQGELKAVLELFRATKHIDDDLLVLCDSQYVINCITKWMRGWKAKGWRKADGKPVLNVDLLKEIDAEIVGRRYRFEWVKGHANHPLNEAADVRARGAAESFQRGAPVRSGPGYTAPGRAAIAAPTSNRSTPEAAATARTVTSAHSELFSFDEDAGDLGDAPESLGGQHSNDHPVSALRSVSEQRSITLTLTADDFDRLTQRARVRGLSIEDCLRALI
ncbi:ribonuclease H family protein [Cryobacterium psychrophilum]|uniref:Ribonuclease H n=1 Tax=Cryobacterium psychrophilum TaxID=41988 RepID=A0A4Y8KQC3_9MICO|nr:ribonuclease H [Cryobacterium psychrophilum]TDW29282.1 ribonuclease HI [Cryobacterium psychrophilum]TFD79961.1 ribonuclease HI [Cryobacterium psychrophilum]